MKPLLIAFLCLLALPAHAAPRWDAPFELGGLRLQIPEAEVEERLGPADREIDAEMRLYRGLLVRVRDGRVVNLSAGEGWPLGQEGTEVARTGGSESALLESFGEPREIYAKDMLKVLLFGGQANDVGVMVHGGLVVGFLLAEPDMLSPSLLDSGYRPVK